MQRRRFCTLVRLIPKLKLALHILLRKESRDKRKAPDKAPALSCLWKCRLRPSPAARGQKDKPVEDE